MAIRDTAAHLPAVGSHERHEVGHQLQATLIELIELSLFGKQLHWSVVGPHFRPLHEQLDGLVDSWGELADSVAERAVTIGFWPDGQSSALASGSELPNVQAGAVDGPDALREITRSLAIVAERVRERMNRVGELDLVSQDVLTEVLRSLEQQLWMVRVQSEHRG